MANRVVVGPLPGGGHGIRVSRPGFNVLSTSLQPKQVAFDSRWPRAERVFMTGFVTTQAGGSAVTVNFGVTFSVPPVTFVMRRGGAVSGSHPMNLYWASDFGQTAVGGWTDQAWSDMQVYTNRIVFAAPHFGTQQDYEYCYLVLRPD